MYNKNTEELDKMILLAKDIGAGHQISFEMTPRYDGTKESLNLRMSHNQIKKIYTSTLKDSIPFLKKAKDDMRCGCARTNCAVAANGDVYPCIGAPIKAGNIRLQSLKSIWNQSETFKMIRNLKVEDHKKCSTCSDRMYCPRSPGAAYISTGDYSGAEEWTCSVAQTFKNIFELGNFD